jgi:hypothetical protein
LGPRGPTEEGATELSALGPAAVAVTGGVEDSCRLAGCPALERLGWEGVQLVTEGVLAMQTDTGKETEVNLGQKDAVGG